MSFDLAELKNRCAVHGPVCRVLVVATKGSVPRGAGTAMLVWDGGQSGTIGGGALEYEAVSEARRLRDTGESRALRTQPLGPALGQCCGGSVTLLWEWFEARDLGEFDELQHGYLRPVLATASELMPVSLREGVAQRSPHPILQDGWLAEPLSSATTPVWIYGGGHVGRALATCLAPLPDFSVTLIDTAAARLPDPMPANITPMVARDPARFVAHAPRGTHHLVMTYSHALDLEICHQLLQHGFASAGLIGSATKWVRFQNRLRHLGHAQLQIMRITCPIGEPRLGKHPQEIAIGVARSLLSARSQLATPKEIAS